MAKVNDLQCIGDALFQSDVKVKGKLNNEVLDVDDNCLIIDVCRRLDLSTVGNKIEITIPNGYVGDPCASGTYQGTLYLDTYGSNALSWTTPADVTFKYVRADDSTEASYPMTGIGNYNTTTVGLIPFVKSYIKAEVVTAAVGTKTFAVIRGRIYCHKE